MPRIPRGQQAGFVYHVINRGNGRATIFHKAQDYQAFLSILALAKARHPVKLFAFSLMPNHFHFVIESSHHQSLSRFMQWLLTSHVRRYHKHYGSSGHVWQGRFKSFPVQRDEHLLWCCATFCKTTSDQVWPLRLMTGHGQVGAGVT
jgi:putative transposase